jgi:predicted HNH restriction endonuclease
MPEYGDAARRKAKTNINTVCPNCHKPYFQVGNFKPEDVCQCNKKK